MTPTASWIAPVHALARRLLPFVLALPAWASADAPCPPEPQPPTAAQIAELAAQARDRGVLWRMTKDGRTAWLYGTMHVGKPEWLFPGPEVGAALREAEVIALELDPTDPATAAATQQLIEKMPSTTLSPAQSERLRVQRRRACQDTEVLARTHPVMQLLVLQLLDARGAGLHPAFAQEGMLAGFARAAGRPIVALETPELQMRHVMPGDPAAQRALVESSLSLLESGRAAALMGRLGGHWERGELDALGSYFEWCECAPTDDDRQYMKLLNDGRNPGLAEQIDALHAQGRKAFFAVGALHMTGDLALPTLLARRGWRVERVTFKP